MENLEAVMRRIRKLLAIAQDSRGDPHECAAAARMAESVMRKYQIDNVDLIQAELASGGGFNSAFVGTGSDPMARASKRDQQAWAGILAVALARLYDCQARYAEHPALGVAIRFDGYGPDVVMAEQTYHFIVNNLVAARRHWAKGRQLNLMQFATEGESFRRGYIQGVVASIKAMTADKANEMKLAAPTGSALMVVKAKLVEQHFGPVNYGKKNISRNDEAYAVGREKGRQLDVGRRGISGGGSPLMIK